MLSDSEPPSVVDVREPWEYVQGHVPGSLLIPLSHLPRSLEKLDPAAPTAVICEHGSRSQAAANFLVRRGFRQVFNVVGGTEAWRRSGLAVDRK